MFLAYALYDRRCSFLAKNWAFTMALAIWGSTICIWSARWVRAAPWHPCAAGTGAPVRPAAAAPSSGCQWTGWHGNYANPLSKGL